MEGAITDPILGEDVVLQVLLETPKWHIVLHGSHTMGPIACLAFGNDEVQSRSNHGDGAMGLGIGEFILPPVLREVDLIFFNQAQGLKHKHLL
jgi:hypothetical protein